MATAIRIPKNDEEKEVRFLGFSGTMMVFSDEPIIKMVPESESEDRTRDDSCAEDSIDTDFHL